MNSHNHIYSHFTPSDSFTVESEFICLHPCYMHYNIQIQALIILLFCFKFIFCYTVKVVIYAGG